MTMEVLGESDVDFYKALLNRFIHELAESPYMNEVIWSTHRPNEAQGLSLV
ncbi:hypothetical protein GQ54DRAFT_315038 [Martensiomyces pterosporus]|nr:hypothetical protein GQ54DRAFT_315038 [Martensiomyces pterosporus]